jgi:ankyrin repeat domain-containing protein 50
VYCQLDYICSVIPSRIRRALAALPETLDGIYERTLREINNAQWDIAHHIFQFVVVARCPLRAKELANLLAFDFDAAPTPEFHESWCLEDPVDAVLSTCPSLLMAVDVKGSSVIQFSHVFVRDFLTSDRLADANDNTLRRYHVSITPAHTLAAQACLGILLHLDMDVVTRDSLKKIPLAKYAAKHLFFHARFDDVLQNVEDGMKQLFDPRKTHLAVSLWIYNPIRPPGKHNKRTKRPRPSLNSPLHYAAFWGLHSIVKFLVTEHSQDVHDPSHTDGATPLHQASGNGHIHVARFLLERGADVTAQAKDGSTPLHLASRRGQVEVVRMLIEHGADVMAKDKKHQA